jgi:peptide/nickel transport system permease protein
MSAFLAQRLSSGLLTLLFVSMLVFGLQQLIPGDPAVVLAGEDQDPNVVAFLHQKLHLDEPMPVRYGYWLQGLMHGDLGGSARSQEPVTRLIAQKLPVTLELACLAMLILLFSVHLGWFPASGYVSPLENWHANLAAMVMPAFVLGNAIAAVLMRHTRSALLTALEQDYVRTARAKGLGEVRVVLHHAWRNALAPVITLGALELGGLLSGAVLTEQVFTIPGFGKLVVDSVFNRDYAVVQGVVLVTASAYVLLNMLADLAFYLINPRLRG